MRRIIASLDIGSNTIKLLVGEIIKNRCHILCVSEVPSKGIKKGLIENQEELIPVLKETFHKAEEMLSLPIKEVIVSIPDYEVETFMSEGYSSITNEDHVITESDIIRAMQAASYNKINNDRELISMIPIRYKVDEEIVKNPLNMLGNKIGLKAVIITSPKDLVNSYLRVLDKIGVKGIDVVLSSLGNYTSNQNKELAMKIGAVINIGEDITTVSIFNKGVLMKSEVIELGGKNIDNDIAYIYKITKKDARELKENLGLAASDMASENEKTTLTDRMGDNITITEKSLSEIIESRLIEILELSKKQINLLTKKDIDYVLITGGTSEMRDFNILNDKVFTKEHILGKIDNVGVRNNKYSSALGIIKYYNERLKLRNKEYSIWSPEELETLSEVHKKVNINEKSVLGKLFGYFFDS